MATGTIWICLSSCTKVMFHILQEVDAELKVAVSDMLTWERECSLIISNMLRYAESCTDNDRSNCRLVCNISNCDVADAHFMFLCDLTQSEKKFLKSTHSLSRKLDIKILIYWMLIFQ
jgi:hypothetical protein